MAGKHSPFDSMYESFELFSAAAAARGDRVVQMSAGANWVGTCPAVRKLLHLELDSGLTTWNYGRSAGPAAVTDALEYAEAEMGGGQCRPAVTVVNGTAEGASLVLHQLADDGRAPPGSAALMVGHGFPLYSHLCASLGLEFREVLGESDGRTSYLPPIDRVVGVILRDRPAVAFLIVPNNPIGECYPEVALRRLAGACAETGATLVVDRVCLLPWDDYAAVARATAPLVAAGRCFAVDSFSKADSLAGLRTGFVVSSPADRDRLLLRTRARCLNPITFSTLTLAFCRLAVLPRAAEAAARAEAVVDGLNCERRAAPGAVGAATLFADFRAEYRRDLAVRERVVRGNHRALLRRMGAAATRPLTLDAGFNVALTLPAMAAGNERSDQCRLAHEHGVGVLTERCFRNSPRAAGHYFVRVGLTLPADEFGRGLNTLGDYFGA